MKPAIPVPDLLDPNQRYFAYASVCLEDDEAKEIINLVRARHPVRMPELKASRLMRTARGRALIAEVIEKMRGKFAINVYDKLVALCGWIFEYIYEPVYQHNPTHSISEKPTQICRNVLLAVVPREYLRC